MAVLFALVGGAGCAKTIDDGGSSDVDFTRPKKVVASIFYAAESGDAGHLESLCDPEASLEGARRICAVQKDSGEWQSFVRNFRRGRIIGEPRISGDDALVNVAYGPEGATSETFELRRRGERWFLHDF